jgi:hypothetical protein
MTSPLSCLCSLKEAVQKVKLRPLPWSLYKPTIVNRQAFGRNPGPGILTGPRTKLVPAGFRPGTCRGDGSWRLFRHAKKGSTDRTAEVGKYGVLRSDQPEVLEL